MQAWSNLLKAEMAKRNVNQSELSVIIKKPTSTISHWLAGSRVPPISEIIEVLKSLGITKFSLNSDSSITVTNQLRQRAGYLVEVLKICAKEEENGEQGQMHVVDADHIDAIKSIEYSDEKAHQIFGTLPHDRVKILTVSSDSMAGTIEAGDLVFIDSSKTRYDGDGIYIFLFQNTLFVKRLQRVVDKLLVISDNDRYITWEVEENKMNQIIILGKVMLSQTHKLKRHS